VPVRSTAWGWRWSALVAMASKPHLVIPAALRRRWG